MAPASARRTRAKKTKNAPSPKRSPVKRRVKGKGKALTGGVGSPSSGSPKTRGKSPKGKGKSQKGESPKPTCCVCFEEGTAANPLMKLPVCSHTMHPPCFRAWAPINASCPLCRKRMSLAQVATFCGPALPLQEHAVAVLRSLHSRDLTPIPDGLADLASAFNRALGGRYSTATAAQLHAVPGGRAVVRHILDIWALLEVMVPGTDKRPTAAEDAPYIAALRALFTHHGAPLLRMLRYEDPDFGFVLRKALVGKSSTARVRLVLSFMHSEGQPLVFEDDDIHRSSWQLAADYSDVSLLPTLDVMWGFATPAQRAPDVLGELWFGSWNGELAKWLRKRHANINLVADTLATPLAAFALEFVSGRLKEHKTAFERLLQLGADPLHTIFDGDGPNCIMRALYTHPLHADKEAERAYVAIRAALAKKGFAAPPWKHIGPKATRLPLDDLVITQTRAT